MGAGDDYVDAVDRVREVSEEPRLGICDLQWHAVFDAGEVCKGCVGTTLIEKAIEGVGVDDDGFHSFEHSSEILRGLWSSSATRQRNFQS